MGLFDVFRKKKVELTEEQLKWNKIWDLWVEKKSETPYTELMTYHSEVNNGGHSQYFTNVENIGDLGKEMYALGQILPSKLESNLKKAYKAYLVLEEKEDERSKEILEECDDVFCENEGELICVLEEYASKMKL